MQSVPGYVYALFGIAFVLGTGLFWKATGYARSFLPVLIIWTLLHSWLALHGFYDDPRTMTYRLPILIVPIIVLGFFARSSAGKGFMSRLDLGALTLFHLVRAPFEIILNWLSTHGDMPKGISMWSGENFDILIGLSAPIVWYFVFIRGTLERRWLVLWNIAGLILLAMPCLLAMLSLPARYRFFGFGRPDVAIGYFPFILLPAALVPLAFFAHFSVLKRLRFPVTVK